eukprot:11222913-Lingulodinium_polyedra.AAC.1
MWWRVAGPQDLGRGQCCGRVSAALRAARWPLAAFSSTPLRPEVHARSPVAAVRQQQRARCAKHAK